MKAEPEGFRLLFFGSENRCDLAYSGCCASKNPVGKALGISRCGVRTSARVAIKFAIAPRGQIGAKDAGKFEHYSSGNGRVLN